MEKINNSYNDTENETGDCNVLERLDALFRHKKAKSIYINIYTFPEVITIGRIREKNVKIKIKDGYLRIEKNNNDKDLILDLPVDLIENPHMKSYAADMYEIRFNVKELIYAVLIKV